MKKFKNIVTVIFVTVMLINNFVNAQNANKLLISESQQVENIFILSGNNKISLDNFLKNYKKDSIKLKAARFLLTHMQEDKFSYEGNIIQKYDTMLSLYSNLRSKGIFVGDPPVITNIWNELKDEYGAVNPSLLQKSWDYLTMSTSSLIENTDIAFNAWQNAPSFVAKDFTSFCEYVLPHRVGHEHIEAYRNSYYNKYRILVDSAKTPEGIIKGFNREFVYGQEFRSSGKLWDYPLEYSVSKMEIGRRGGCRQLTNYAALVMRACGLPVTIDRVIWANRSIGHEWNVMLLDSNKFLPFDAFDSKRIVLTYKPAKIFRRKYSRNISVFNKESLKDIPEDMINNYEEDVTNLYCKTYDISISISTDSDKYKKKKLAVICVFDNKNWKIVHYGRISAKKINFEKMPADVAYMAAFYDDGMLIQAAKPFILRGDGTIEYCVLDSSKRINMNLTRKYPRFKRIEDFAWGLRRTNFEGANNSDFSDRTILFSIYDIPFGITDSIIKNKKQFRYLRFHAADYRQANFAEVEFFGKQADNQTGEEEKLTGEINGYPLPNENDIHTFKDAMDGNLETWFEKKVDSVGWVGIDLGEGKKASVTRVRFCPRSDTNFILEGDVYELSYWDEEWKSFGEQTATGSILSFKDVPSKTFYILHNLSRGNEERIFTYEQGQQVWW